MKFSLTRTFFSTLFASLAILSLLCLNANAQGIGQNFFGQAYSRSGSDVQSLYNSNAQGPLGGLFAPGFTRTATILGGLNFPSAGFSDIFAGEFNASLDPAGFADGVTELEEPGYALSFAFGRRHSNTLRSEIEVGIRGNDQVTDIVTGLPNSDLMFSEETDGRVTAISLMKNFIIDFDNNTRFTPYVGAGLGISYVEIERFDDDGSVNFEEGETLFSYQAIGGVATRLTSLADFIVEYRFLGTSEVEFEEFGESLAYNTSNLFFGVKLEY